MSKQNDRIFVIGCGSSSMHPDLMNFLKNEYVIAVSQWALLYQKFPFDFYFINDNYRWRKKEIREKMYDFFETDLPKWSKTLGKDSVFLNEREFFETFRTSRVLGKNSYSAIQWNYEFGIDETLLENGRWTLDNPEKYFSDEYFKNIKVHSTGYGSVTRCAVDLAFRLRFKKCYILNFDSIPLVGTAYNEHISDVFQHKIITEENINNSDAYRNCGFSKPVWKKRHEVYSKYGMEVKRVITQEVDEYERRFCNGENNKINSDVVSFFKPRRFFFETLTYEELANGTCASIPDVKVLL